MEACRPADGASSPPAAATTAQTATGLQNGGSPRTAAAAPNGRPTGASRTIIVREPDPDVTIKRQCDWWDGARRSQTDP